MLALPRGHVPAHASPIPRDAVICKVTSYGSVGDESCPERQERREAAGRSRLSPAPSLCPWLERDGMGRAFRGTLAAQTEVVPALIWQKRAQR